MAECKTCGGTARQICEACAGMLCSRCINMCYCGRILCDGRHEARRGAAMLPVQDVVNYFADEDRWWKNIPDDWPH